MQTGTQTATASPSKAAMWTGRIMGGLIIAFLIMDVVLKFMKPQPVVDTFARIGWPMSTAVPLATILLTSVILYVIPQTGVLGAILLTGYLGGAVATHYRIGDPLATH